MYHSGSSQDIEAITVFVAIVGFCFWSGICNIMICYSYWRNEKAENPKASGIVATGIWFPPKDGTIKVGNY